MTGEYEVNLRCSPSKKSKAVRAIRVFLQREWDKLRLGFRLDGDISRVRLPSVGTPAQDAELWRHTCFEAFLSIDGESAYHEFNFAPSGQWQAYRFRGYRDGGPLSDDTISSDLLIRSTASDFELEAAIRLGALSKNHTNAPLRVGLSAVIEEDESYSYWALYHPSDRPDFHDARGFTLLLERLVLKPQGVQKV